MGEAIKVVVHKRTNESNLTNQEKEQALALWDILIEHIILKTKEGFRAAQLNPKLMESTVT